MTDEQTIKRLLAQQEQDDYLSRVARYNALVAALEILAAYPLEDFGKENAADERPLFGANSWRLNVGHVRAARAALKAVKASD